MEQQFEQEKRLTSEAQNIPPLTQEEAAEFLLAESGNAEAAALSALLQQEAHARRKEERATLAWSGVFLVSMVWLASRSAVGIAPMQQSLLVCFLLMLLLFGAIFTPMFRRTKRHARLLKQELAQIKDKKQIGPLIRALRTQNYAVRNLVKQVLTRLLPTLKESDASLIGSEERKILMFQLAVSPCDGGYRSLSELFSRAAYQRELDLRLAILKALEQVGGVQELHAVERLAKGLPTVQSAIRVPQELKEAARECVPYLQRRADEQRDSAQLLRASSVPDTPQEVLLRPATSHLDDLPEQLLRASQNRS